MLGKVETIKTCLSAQTQQPVRNKKVQVEPPLLSVRVSADVIALEIPWSPHSILWSGLFPFESSSNYLDDLGSRNGALQVMHKYHPCKSLRSGFERRAVQYQVLCGYICYGNAMLKTSTPMRKNCLQTTLLVA